MDLDKDRLDQWEWATKAQKQIKSLEDLLAVKDAGMKALEKEVERLTDDLKEVATLIDFKLGYKGYDVDKCKSERDWLIKELATVTFRSDNLKRSCQDIVKDIEFTMNKALEGGEDE